MTQNVFWREGGGHCGFENQTKMAFTMNYYSTCLVKTQLKFTVKINRKQGKLHVYLNQPHSFALRKTD